MTQTTFTPRDARERERISKSLNETLFVEAGAGTGKTTSLVDRTMTLVTSGATILDRIAAITFTEAAAAELRDRIRNELESAAASEPLSQEVRERCVRGVEDLDQASIGTLHGFAGALLTERPLEAGLPPTFEVMDQIAADLEFQEVWRSWIDSALEGNVTAPTLSLALSLGLTPDHLHHVAVQFHKNYDLLVDAPLDDAPAPVGAVVQELCEAGPELERLCGYSRIGESDTLFNHVQRLVASIRRLAEMESGSPSAYRLLDRTLPIRKWGGRQRDWDADPASGENACKSLKETLFGLDERAVEELAEVRLWALMPILRALRSLILSYAEDRRQRGRAGFHDLLVWARNLLRDDVAVRDHFRGRFSHILIDEAQDTDPLQTEIAMFLAEDVSRTVARRKGDPCGHTAEDGERRTAARAVPTDCLREEASNRPTNWDEIVPEVGKLFVVGDPKQSIYRFRRADVRQLNELRRVMQGETVQLVQNFRSQRPVLNWVNHLFSRWMQGGGFQAEYVPLLQRWEAETAHPGAPGVWQLGDREVENAIDPVRRKEARGIAGLLAQIVEGGWQILDTEATNVAGEERYRPARYSDICILMPTRTGLRMLEIALDEARVPYRLEGASLIFETQEVRDLLNCLRAIDDPADQVAIVAALRSPAFACSDIELLEFYEAGGRFDYLSERELLEGRVAASLGALRRYHGQRTWSPIPLLIDSFIRERRLKEAAIDHPRTREVWRRYRFIVESARAFVEAGGNSLRGFLQWAARQAEEGARISETPAPESDEEAVRVMTIHGAKGLEFPVVVLTGLNSGRSSLADSVLFDRERGGVEVSIGRAGSRFTTAGYQPLAAIEGAMQEDEFVRLQYVAATRARDHLVISTYRTERDTTSAAAKIMDLMEGADDLWKKAPTTTPSVPGSCPGQALSTSTGSGQAFPKDGIGGVPDTPQREHSIDALERWRSNRETMLLRQGRPSSVSATALAGIAKEELGPTGAEFDEPWKRGRGGAPLGRAVHSVLQTIDLATGRGIDETAGAQAAAEGIPDRQAEVASLVAAAVESEIVKRAVASGRLWREVPAAVPVGVGVLQGYIDLLFEEEGELVVVDYKTDAIDADETEDAVDRYRLQAGAYALMVSQTTNMPVKAVVFLFLRPKREQWLTDVRALEKEAESAARTFLQSATGASSDQGA